MASFKSDPEAVKQACTRLKIAGGLGEGAAPPIANTMLTWLVPETLICCQASLHKQGVVGRALFANILLASRLAWFQNKPRLSSKLAHGLRQRGGLRGQPPPIASTMLAEVPDEGADLARLREQESCSFLGILGGPKKQIHYRGVDLKFV